MRTLRKLPPILLVTAITLCIYAIPEQAFAAGDIEAKVKEGLKQIQAFLTGIVVIVGICVGVWIIIKKLPGVDDPHTKNEMFRGVGMVFGRSRSSCSTRMDCSLGICIIRLIEGICMTTKEEVKEVLKELLGQEDSRKGKTFVFPDNVDRSYNIVKGLSIGIF